MPEDEEDKKEDDKTEKSSGTRMDAAKAFFRAMYAGDEAPEGASQAEPSSGADSRRVRELEQQIRDLEQQLGDSEKISKRMAADFENFRRRMDREREDLSNAGVRRTAEAIIPALDDLDRAMLYLNPDTPSEKVIESFQLVANRIMQCLESAGLKRLNTKGVIFDPRFHEPVQQIETNDHPDGSIVHELRGGYILGDRVIRPALVNVALNNSVDIPPLDQSGNELQASSGDSSGSGDSGGTDSSGGGSETADNATNRASAPAEVEEQGGSVATASDEDGAKARARAAASSDPEDKVYDLGDL